MSLDTIGGRRGSFEEEYYDMIRAAFLEYSFQARIGNMSGIFVAYHNVARIFGFQYISLEEIDLCLFGREGAGERVFSRCVHLLEVLYKEIIKCLPENVRYPHLFQLLLIGTNADYIHQHAVCHCEVHLREARLVPPRLD